MNKDEFSEKDYRVLFLRIALTISIIIGVVAFFGGLGISLLAGFLFAAGGFGLTLGAFYGTRAIVHLIFGSADRR